MNFIRKATENDLARIAEIQIFNYRLYFYPIFKTDDYFFGDLQVPNMMKWYGENLPALWVYDDDVVKGFIMIDGTEDRRLFVEPVLHSQSIGSKLLTFAVEQYKADCLWALEKNDRAIAFYQRHGFHKTGERKLEEGTSEYLIRMAR